MSIKKNSNPKTEISGGLMPLPKDESPLQILTAQSSSCTLLPSRENQDSTRSLSESASNAIGNVSSDLENKDSSCEDEENLCDSDYFVEKILSRREEWENNRKDMDEYLADIENAIQYDDSVKIVSSKPPLPTPEIDPPAYSLTNTSPMMSSKESRMQEKIRKGLETIKELDLVILEKTGIAQRLTQSREQSQTASESSSSSQTPSWNSVSESTDEFDEMRSVNSYDTRTFITEPKFHKRVSKRFSYSTVSDSEDEFGRLDCNGGYKSQKNGKKRGYQLGNFVERNIVLGPEARYYSAMTEEEKDRVNSILEREESDDEFQFDGFEGSASNPNMESEGETHLMSKTDKQRLLEIDEQLSQIYPNAQHANPWEVVGDTRRRLQEIDVALSMITGNQ